MDHTSQAARLISVSQTTLRQRLARSPLRAISAASGLLRSGFIQLHCAQPAQVPCRQAPCIRVRAFPGQGLPGRAERRHGIVNKVLSAPLFHAWNPGMFVAMNRTPSVVMADLLEVSHDGW